MEKDKPAGAGFEGTRRLVKRYKKETPGQPVDEVYRKSGLGKWFHGEKAKGTEPGWDRYNTKGERIGKCGDAKEGEAYAACLSRQKAAKLGKKKVGSFVSRKRAAQRSAGDPEKGGESTKGDKPVFVKTGITDKDPKKKGIQDMLDPFDFANILIEEMINEKNKPTNPALWDQAISKAKSKFDVYPSAYANAWASKWYKAQGGGWKTAESVELDEAEKDHEYSMARAQLSTIEKAVMNLKKKMKGEGNLEAWVQSKITKAADYIDSVSDYIDSGEHDIEEDWQKVNRKDNVDGLSQKAVDAYRRENPGSKLQTAVTEKNPKGKRAARRASFCSRMSGMKDKLTSSETANDPDSRINKALRRWNC